MSLRVKVNRTFVAKNVYVEFDVAGQKISGEIDVEYHMPTVEQRNDEKQSLIELLDLSREVDKIVKNDDGSPKQKLSEEESAKTEALLAQIKLKSNAKSNLLNDRLVSIDGLEFEGPDGNLVDEKDVVKVALNDMDISRCLLIGYGEAMEKKERYTPKKPNSGTTSATS